MDARCEKRTAVSFSLQGYSGAMLLPLPPLVWFFSPPAAAADVTSCAAADADAQRDATRSG